MHSTNSLTVFFNVVLIKNKLHIWSKAISLYDVIFVSGEQVMSNLNGLLTTNGESDDETNIPDKHGTLRDEHIITFLDHDFTSWTASSKCAF